MEEKTVIKLKKNTHLSQLLGVVDKHGNYCLDEEIAHTVISLQKFEIDEPDKIDIGNEYISLQSDSFFDGKPLFFRVEIEKTKDGRTATLFLQEEADEMGGLIAYTYLTPLVVFESNNLDTFLQDIYEQFQIENGSDNEADIAKLDTHIKKRNAKRRSVELEAERLSRAYVTRINQALAAQAPTCPKCAEVKKELDDVKKTAKRFTREGKPDYNQAQVQMVKHIIERRDSNGSQELGPIVQILEKHERRMELVAKKNLSEEIAVDVKQATVERKSAASGGTMQKQHSTRRDAIIKRLPAMERAAIMSSKLNFNELFSHMKGNKKRQDPLKLSNDGDKKREQFTKEYEKKSARIFKIIDANEEAAETEFNDIAIAEEEAKTDSVQNSAKETIDIQEQIEQVVAEGMKNYSYTTEEKKKAALTEFVKKTEYQKIMQQPLQEK